MKNAISVKNLVVKYDNFQLDNVSFDVPKGSIVGFVGENGAGKTTTIQAILNLQHHFSGDVFLLEKNIRDHGERIKEKVGVVLDEGFFYEKFTMKEIGLVLKNVFKNWNQQYFEQLLADGNINLMNSFKECSKGMKAKVKLYCALAHEPEILLLDEPTSGLDPVSREEILDIFYDFIADANHTILFSSHITSDIEKLADYVIFIQNGEIVFNLEQDYLKNNFGILRVTKEQEQDLGEFSFLYRYETNYSIDFLIDNRFYFLKEFPDLVLEYATLEDILLIMKKGEKNERFII